MQKRRLFFILVSIVFLQTTAVFSRDLTFTLSPTVSLSHSDIKEYVDIKDLALLTKSSQEKYVTGNLLSELDWNDILLVTFGVQAQFSLKWLSFDFGVEYAPLTETGDMQDYDWLLDDSQNTEFSTHELTCNSRTAVFWEMGVTVLNNDSFAIKPLVGYEFIHTDLCGHDGYLDHSYRYNEQTPLIFNGTIPPTYYEDGNSGEERLRQTVPGTNITYNHMVEFVWLGTEFIYRLSWLNIGIAVEIAPFIKSINQDNHYQGKTIAATYIDEITSHLAYKGKLTALLTPEKRSGFCLNAGMIYLPKCLGNDYISEANGSFSLSNSVYGGTGYFGWNVGVSYRIRIF